MQIFDWVMNVAPPCLLSKYDALMEYNTHLTSCYIPVKNYKTVYFTAAAWLQDTCYEFSAAVCPIEGLPLGRGGYDPGGARAFFTVRAGGHCCSDTYQTQTNIEKQITTKK